MKIKCMAWNKELKKMYSAEELSRDQIMLMTDGRGFSWWIDKGLSIWEEMIPLLYTGRKDKNGNEIYESHFLKYDSQKYSLVSGIYLVSWSDDELSFICEREEPYNYLLPDIWSECEIVGNIYENTELLSNLCCK